MKQIYKVLGSMLALKEFTINDLAKYSGVNRGTVDTLYRRYPQFWEVIEQEKNGKRGGQSVRFRVKPEEVQTLQRTLSELFNEVKTLTGTKAERDRMAEARSEVAWKPLDPPVSLAAGEEALLYLFPKAESAEEKQTLLAAADSDLRSGQLEVEILSKRAADPRQVEGVKALLHRVAVLKKLSEAELAIENGLSLRGELQPQTLLPQLFDSWQYLIRSGDSERMDVLKKRIGKFVQRISEQPPGDVVAVAPARDTRAAAAAAAATATKLARVPVVEPGSIGRHTIAVLPLSTSSFGQEYVGHGVTQGIARSLSFLPGLAVKIPSQYSLSRGEVEDEGAIRSVGRQLEVDAVLTGVVNSMGNDVLCDTLLVGTSEGRVWRHRYKHGFADLFEVGADISRTVSQALNIKLPNERAVLIGEQPTDNSEAQKLYMEGRYNWSQWSADGLKKAIDCYEQALEKDLKFALAYAGLADCYNMLTYCTEASPRQAFTKAKAAAYEALEYNDSLAEAYTSLAYALARYYWRWTEAEEEFQRALTLNPSYTIARQWYAELLAGLGRFPEALAQINLALELEPKSPIVSVTMGTIYYFNRRYDLAINQFKGVLENDPEFLRAHFRLGGVYVQVGRYDEAITHLQKALRLSHGNMRELAMLGYAYAAAGNHTGAREILHELLWKSGGHYVASYNLALIHTALGEFDDALDRLQVAIEQRSPWLTFIKVDPRFDPLRDRQRFHDVVEAVAL